MARWRECWRASTVRIFASTRFARSDLADRVQHTRREFSRLRVGMLVSLEHVQREAHFGSFQNALGECVGEVGARGTGRTGTEKELRQLGALAPRSLHAGASGRA